MPSLVIVPDTPGPLLEDTGPAGVAEEQRGAFGAPEIALSVGGLALLIAVLGAGWPSWLSVVAIAFLALGLALPAHAALLRRSQRARERGTPLTVSDGPVRRLVAAYRRLERTVGPGLALDAAHLAVTEVAALLDGRAPRGDEEAYVTRRAEAVSALADHLTDLGGLDNGCAPSPDSDSLTRIEALLGN